MAVTSQHADAPSHTSSATASIHGDFALTEKKSDVEENILEVSQPTSALGEFPEGGLAAWLAVAGGAMVTFCTFGVVQSYGVYQSYYFRYALSGHSSSVISLIGSLQAFFVFAMGLPAGKLATAGYFHHVMIAGTILYIFSQFMLSLAKPHHYYQHILAQGVGMGMGMGMMFLPALTLASHYFYKRRSLAMGIVIVGGSMGGIVYPILLNNVFKKHEGYEWGVRGVAFMDMGLLIIANLIMRTRLPPKKPSPTDPKLKDITRDIPFLIYGLGGFLVFWGIFIPFFYIQVYALAHGVNRTFTNYSITIMNASSILGRTVPNFLADKYGPLNVLIVSGFITGGLIFSLFGATNVGGVTAFAIVYGFFSGGLISVAAPGVASFITRADMADLPLRIGFLSFFMGLALLTGNPIAGALIGNLEWWKPLTFAAVVTFAGTMCFVAVWPSISRRRGTKRV